MNLILLHGYLLQGTGSNIYAANVARAWRRQGHAVTVICQDLQAGALKFVDEYVGPGGKLPPQPPAPATIRVVVPDINKLLPVYVLDRYAGFQVKTIPAMTTEEIENHISMTAERVCRKPLYSKACKCDIFQRTGSIGPGAKNCYPTARH